MSNPVVEGPITPTSRWLPTRAKAIRIAVAYGLLSATWIVCSGWVLRQLVQDPNWTALLEDLKGWFFVLVTASLLGWFLDTHFRTIRHAVERICASETKLQLIGDNLPDSYVYQFTRAPDGRPEFLYISAGVKRVHGVPATEIQRDANLLLSQIDPARAASLLEAEQVSARDLTNFEEELRIRRADGEVRTIQIQSRPRRTADGQVQWDGFAQDITERKLAEVALRASEAKWRSYIESAPVGVLVADAHGKHVEVNRCAEEMFGYPPGGMLGTSAMELPADHNGQALRRHLDELAQHGQSSGQFWLRRKDGSQLWALVRATRLEAGRLLGVFQNITDLKRAEEALRQSEQRLNFALQKSGTGGWELDLVSHQAHRTLQHDKIFGYDSLLPEWTYEMFLDHVLPEERQGVDRLFREATAAQTDWNFECRIRRQDGEVRWIWATGGHQADDTGKVRRLAGIVQDITERKAAEAALQQSERLLRTVIDLVPHFIFAKDRHSRYLFANRACAAAGGFSPEQMVNKCDRELSANPAEAEAFMQVDRAVIESGEPRFVAEERLTDVAGRTRILQTVKLPFEMPGVGPALVGVAVDITDVKAAEAALRQSEENFRAMFEMASIGMAQTDLRTGQWLRVNRKMCEITGYTMEELLQKKVPEITHPEDRGHDWELFQQVVRGEAPDYRMEKRYLRKDGMLAWVNVNMTVIRDATGEPIRAMATIEDVSERRRLEERFHQAQKMEAIGQLAGGIAHDFNNILAAMLMQAELASSAEHLPKEVADGLSEIQRAAERAANLTRQLLMFSRKQVLQVSELDLNEAVTNLAKMLQRIIGEDVRLQLHLHHAPLMTRADSGMLDQILMNLAVNARDAMPEGGKLLIETGETTLEASAAQLHPEAAPGRYVWLSVADTGCGIPPQVLPRIFEPFFTTKEVGKGTGLGLATVFGILKQHQGWIQVESRPGAGATFKVFLPASNRPQQEQETASAEPRGGTECILLVEDDTALRRITQKLLKQHGYTVFAAANGVEALNIWGQKGASVALLLTDMVMPGGITGQQLARKVQAQKPSLKVIFTTGYSAELAGRGIQLRPGENFMQKPYPPQELLDSLRRCLDA